MRAAIADAVHLAETWLDGATALPAGTTKAVAWTPNDWIDNTLDTWKRLCDPVAEQISTVWASALPEEAKSMAGPLLASTAAAELGMSESRFSRFFRRATGNTFTDFVNLVRVNRACQLLMETDRQVTRICYEVGFNNVANFNRRFREIKGMTPSEFRHQAEHRFGRIL